MCGIAGFSRAEGSRLNARALAHNLLAQIERRGDHASGFAWIGMDGTRGVYKQPKPGGQLSLHELPRDAQTVILHTRFATQGSTKDNRNNHPVMSTDNQIALVHNGVISNDGQLLGELGIKPNIHGEVDSLVIPSLIAQQGVSALNKLRGYAAIAWINNDDNAMRIARLKNSPVSYTWTYDGTFVFASTDTLLKKALHTADIDFGGVFEMQDGTMMTVETGFVAENEKAPSMAYDSYSYSRYSNATSGGHGSTSKGSEDTPKPGRVINLSPAWREDDMEGFEEVSEDLEEYFERLEEYRVKRDANKAKIAEVRRTEGKQPEVVFSGGEFIELFGDDDSMTDEELLARLEERDEDGNTIGQRYMQGEGFYIIDGDGSVNHYPTLEDLEGQLAWLAKMTRNEFDIWPDLSDESYWANFIMDIGSVDEKGTIISWVDDSADIDYYESPAVRHLQYIRDGVHKLSTLAG